MEPSYHTTRRVEFSDTDAAGIAHFSAFFRFMEQAEHEFLRSRGLSVMLDDPGGTITWPRVSASCDFDGSVKFEDVLDIELSIDRLGSKSIAYGFVFTHAGRLVGRGKLVAVCCRVLPDGKLAGIEIPTSLRMKLGSEEPSDPAADN